MKKLFLFSVIVALMSSAAVAQETKEKTGPDQRTSDIKNARAEWEKKVKDELKLTPDQITKYDALNKEYNDKFDGIMKDASLDKDAQKDKMMALKKEKDDKFNQILTPEQQATYQQMVEKKKKEMANKSGY